VNAKILARVKTDRFIKITPMYTIDLTVKNSPLPLSVQRKSEEEAREVYDRVLNAIRSGSSELLELTCDKIPGKRVAVLASEIAAVQMAEKTGTSTTGKAPGFAALTS
jgi:hypothetical protein